MLYDILVIGAGAAGMMAATKAARAGCSVAVLERNPFCGKKINITGKGRCNLTNNRTWDEFARHVHPSANFLRPAFYSFSNKDVVSFFEEAGLKTVVTQGGRIYPESMRAADVSRTLVKCMEQAGVDILCGREVISVCRDGEFFLCNYIEEGGRRMDSGSIEALSVIVTTGGLSYPTTGSTGRGYDIAESFDLHLEPLFPSLTALMPWQYDTALSGIDLENVGLTLVVDRTPVQFETGDLSFTDNGIEGALGFRVSRRAVKALLAGQKVFLELDLKPALSVEQLKARIGREMAAMQIDPGRVGQLLMRQLLARLMPRALIVPFIAANPGLSVDSLPAALKLWRFKIQSFTGYERAVVTAGGVSQKDVIAKTLCARNVPGLYFAGEVLDLDGDTGGYNLQIAFSTGSLAGESAAQRILKQRASSE